MEKEQQKVSQQIVEEFPFLEVMIRGHAGHADLLEVTSAEKSGVMKLEYFEEKKLEMKCLSLVADGNKHGVHLLGNAADKVQV